MAKQSPSLPRRLQGLAEGRNVDLENGRLRASPLILVLVVAILHCGAHLLHGPPLALAPRALEDAVVESIPAALRAKLLLNLGGVHVGQ